jgi:hypothetical protein
MYSCTRTPSPPPLGTCSDEEITEHLESIRSVPLALLPDTMARVMLRLLAAAGRDIYCYCSGGEATGTWCVWLGDLADVRADKDGRVPVVEWVTRWRELLDAMLPSMFADPAPAPVGGAA